MIRQRIARPYPNEHYERRARAAEKLLAHMGADAFSDVLVRFMVRDDDSPAVAALVEDLEAAPLVPLSEVSRLVDGAHRTTIDSVLSEALSPMQSGALREMAHGAANLDELGDRLNCSKGSAEMHLRRARVRLAASTNSHAVGMALGMGMFEAPLRHGAEGRFIARSLLRPRIKERDILERLARGLSNGEIAEEIGLSVDTVKDAIDDLREMYGARNRTHLVALAFAVGTLKFVSSRHKEQEPTSMQPAA